MEYKYIVFVHKKKSDTMEVFLTLEAAMFFASAFKKNQTTIEIIVDNQLNM
jgi:hypothetical protein